MTISFGKMLYDINQILKNYKVIDEDDKKIPSEYYYNGKRFLLLTDRVKVELICDEFNENYSNKFKLEKPKELFIYFKNNKSRINDFTLKELEDFKIINTNYTPLKIPDVFKNKGELIYTIKENATLITKDNKIKNGFNLINLLNLVKEYRVDSKHILLFLEFDIENESVYIRQEKTDIDFSENFFLILDSNFLAKLKYKKDDDKNFKVDFFENNIIEISYGNANYQLKFAFFGFYHFIGMSSHE